MSENRLDKLKKQLVELEEYEPKDIGEAFGIIYEIDRVLEDIRFFSSIPESEWEDHI